MCYNRPRRKDYRSQGYYERIIYTPRRCKYYQARDIEKSVPRGEADNGGAVVALFRHRLLCIYSFSEGDVGNRGH